MSSKNRPNVDVNDGKYIKIGLVVIFMVFVVLGGWSAYAELSSGVPAGGQVAVESNKKNIQHLEGGIIEAIYVKDGDSIQKGDKLIKFSGIKSKSELNSMLANYYETIALRDRLLSENKDNSTIHFSNILDELSESKSEVLKKRQLDIFTNETGYLKKREVVSNQKIDSLKEQIASLGEVVKIKKNLLASYKNEIQEQSDLLKNGLVDKVKLVDAQRRMHSVESDILSSESNIRKYSVEINSTKTQLQLDKEKFFTDLNTKLSKAQASIEDMKARISNLRDKLSRTVLKSPVSGSVMNLAYHTIGAVVQPGKVIMEIIPENAQLIVNAKLSPEYIDFVKVGYKAKMTFPSFQMKGRFMENVDGEVTFVSADSTVDKRGTAFYMIKLKITDKGEKLIKDNDLKVQAGMPVSIVVKAGKQTTLEYLLKPLTMMLQRAFLEQ